MCVFTKGLCEIVNLVKKNMADRKLFAGPRLRRIRTELGLTQTAMAESLDVSPSYLNLIERNQRPLTVQIVLKLARTHDIDISALQGENESAVGDLKRVFLDPLLANELPGDHELVEAADALPNVTTAMIKLYRAYREQLERLSNLAEMMAREGGAQPNSDARLPIDEVMDRIERAPYHFPEIEAEVGAFLNHLKPEAGLKSALLHWLKAERGVEVKILPVDVMPLWRRRYDRHSNRLFVSDRLSEQDQLSEIAIEACLMRMKVVLTARAEKLNLTTHEAHRIARHELARYAAYALLLPYEAFAREARRCRFDITRLTARFGVTFEQATLRLVSLKQEKEDKISFFAMEIDHAANRIRRVGANGFPHAQFGGGCPKLNVYQCFLAPRQIFVEGIEMQDGKQFMTISRTLEGLRAGHGEKPRRTGLLVGCEMDHAEQCVYADQLPRAKTMVTQVGPTCRLCERQGCASRAAPPLTRPLGLDENIAGLSAFDFQ